MNLTSEQYTLLYDMFNASIRHAMDSGIPIGNAIREAASVWNNTIGLVYPSAKWNK